MNRFLRFFSIILIVGIAFSCSKDNIEEYYSNNECDTIDVSFSETVFPIVQNNCLACHFEGSSSGVDLTSYDKIKEQIDEGKFLGNIQHASGYSPMPPSYKLDDCTISKIENWINDGAPNN